MPRKTRYYGSLEDLSDRYVCRAVHVTWALSRHQLILLNGGRYQCLDAIVRGAFPNEPMATTAELLAFGQRMGFEMPVVSSNSEKSERIDFLLRDSRTDKNTASPLQAQTSSDTPVVTDSKELSPQQEENSSGIAYDQADSKINHEPVELIRDASGHDHYIGPSGSLQFLGQLRRLLISREKDAVGGTGNQPISSFTKDDTAKALEVDPEQDDSSDTAADISQIRSRQIAQPGDSESTNSSSARAFTRAPTEDVPDVLRCLPDREVIEKLLGSYWKNVHEDFPLFHRGTFEGEYEDFIVKPRRSSGSPSSNGSIPDHGWIGCLHMMIVFGSLSVPSTANVDQKSLRRHCVDVTKKLLPGFITRSTLSGARAVLLLGYYLHSNNERNAAWNLVGTATRICFALGIHREDTASFFRPIEREIRKRVFCTLYGFEQFLASSLGRPSGLNELDVQVIPPRGRIGDSHGVEGSLNTMTLKLHKILSTARNPRHTSAAVAQSSQEADQCTIDEVMQSLAAWKEELSEFQGLDLPVIAETNDPLPGPEGRRMQLAELRTLLGWRDLTSVRATLLLHIQYHYIYLLITRPFLLRTIAAGSAESSTDVPWKADQYSDICLEHACQLARIVILLDSFGIVHGVSGLDIFFAYSAGMVLILRSLRLETHQPDQQAGSLKPEPGTHGAELGQHDGDEPSEKTLLVALQGLITRLREIVLCVPKCSTMRRFARVMKTFEESAYKKQAPNHPADQQVQEGKISGDAWRPTAIPFLRGLMMDDTSLTSTPSPDAGGLDQQMQDVPGIFPQTQHQQHFYGYGTLAPLPGLDRVGAFGGFEHLPELNPWMVGGQLLDQAANLPIYGWEDVESMLGNGHMYRQV